MSVVIRPATQSEQSIIRKIVRAARINPISLNWKRFVVADDDGQIVGVGQIKPHGDGSRELASIAVIPQRQQRGIGSKIIRALLEKENGTLYLTCRNELETYYTRFGFRRIGPDEMPTYFRRAYRFANLFGASIVVMRRGE